MIDRRDFLTMAGALALGAALPAPAQQDGQQTAHSPKPKTRLILLGTAGGPRPKKNHNAPAQVIVAGDALYVVDAGNGVARQIVLAGLSLPKLRHVFITHHHSDHNADYGNLLLLAWGSGLKTPVDTWGPPPLARMTRLFLEMNAYDIDVRIRDEGRVPLAPLIRPHERKEAGLVMEDDAVKVTCTLVLHPMVEPAFAYRFDAADRSIVISGDTARSEALIKLAKGADVLVHEALFLPAVDRLVARIPNAATLKRHLLESHTTAEDCGRVAAAAGVGTLVLSHLVPPDDPEVTEEMWLEAAGAHFKGRIVLGRDLLEV
jgi:ribonuclease BN (tRNA processing enzyme)